MLTSGIENLNSSEKFTSPYYPRRARWYRRIFYLGGAIRHWLALDRIYLPKDITIAGLIGSFLVPGLAVYLRGPRFYGKMAMTACALLFTIFIVWLGYPVGNYAFGLIISIHASGIAYYCSPYLREKEFFFRICFTVLVLIGISLGIFLPIRHAIQNHLLLPVRNGNQVVIVSVQHRPVSLQLGEWVAFNTEKGMIFGKILGLGGDVVGSTTVPENHWLMRAQFVKRYYHHDSLVPTFAYDGSNVDQEVIVSPEEFIGKPFKRWFGRKQILP